MVCLILSFGQWELSIFTDYLRSFFLASSLECRCDMVPRPFIYCPLQLCLHSRPEPLIQSLLFSDFSVRETMPTLHVSPRPPSKQHLLSSRKGKLGTQEPLVLPSGCWAATRKHKPPALFHPGHLHLLPQSSASGGPNNHPVSRNRDPAPSLWPK